MDIGLTARHIEVDQKFKDCVHEKLGRLTKLDAKADRCVVEVCQERNPRLADHRVRVELTCHTRGPVVRAEAAASDEFAALDLAVAKLDMRLRRAADRRRVHHGMRTPVSVAVATGNGVSEPEPTDGDENDTADPPPFVVREKDHVARPMTLEQALFEMELVGHDFYLYVDADAQAPSVVYRRRGYDYGVVRLRSSAS